MSKPKKDVFTEIKKNMPEFADEVNTATTEQLDSRLSQLAKDRQEVQDAKDADEELDDAQETARQFAAPYRDSFKAIALKSRFIIATIKERGGK